MGELQGASRISIMALGVFFHRTVSPHFTVTSNHSSVPAKMVSKCSNPACSASFRYLHSGRLYRFDTMHKHSGDGYCASPMNKVEFYWLCENCMPRFTLVADSAVGTRVVALHSNARAAAAG
jgi:hypothetical protein